jgi:hypothetical protein
MNADLLKPISEASEWFPAFRGRRLSTKAIIRRIRHGQNGVKLKAELDGGKWFTCREWVEEFRAAVTARRVPEVPSPAAQKRAVAAARARLERRYGRRGAWKAKRERVSV